MSKKILVFTLFAMSRFAFAGDAASNNRLGWPTEPFYANSRFHKKYDSCYGAIAEVRGNKPSVNTAIMSDHDFILSEADGIRIYSDRGTVVVNGLSCTTARKAKTARGLARYLENTAIDVSNGSRGDSLLIENQKARAGIERAVQVCNGIPDRDMQKMIHKLSSEIGYCRDNPNSSICQSREYKTPDPNSQSTR